MIQTNMIPVYSFYISAVRTYPPQSSLLWDSGLFFWQVQGLNALTELLSVVWTDLYTYTPSSVHSSAITCKAHSTWLTAHLTSLTTFVLASRLQQFSSSIPLGDFKIKHPHGAVANILQPRGNQNLPSSRDRDRTVTLIRWFNAAKQSDDGTSGCFPRFQPNNYQQRCHVSVLGSRAVSWSSNTHINPTEERSELVRITVIMVRIPACNLHLAMAEFCSCLKFGQVSARWVMAVKLQTIQRLWYGHFSDEL